MTQYNGNADGQDLFTFADDLVNTNSTSYPVKAKARAANKILKDIWTWIFFAYGGQQYDDGNQTDLPSASDALTSGKRVYANATGAISLTGVACLDANSRYYPLVPITLDEIQNAGYTIDNFMITNGIPVYYMPLGDSTYIFPASDTTRSSGFKQYFNRGSVSIASTATTTSPGFASEFHEAVPTGMAMIYAKRKKLDEAVGLINDWNDYQARIKKFYSQRYQQLFPQRIKSRDYTREMI